MKELNYENPRSQILLSPFLNLFPLRKDFQIEKTNLLKLKEKLSIRHPFFIDVLIKALKYKRATQQLIKFFED